MSTATFVYVSIRKEVLIFSFDLADCGTIIPGEESTVMLYLKA